MKKKLEAELISIAHRVLKLKNKSELVQLHQETQKLYEKLSVLRFVEENFGEVKPTIGYKEVEEKLEEAFEEKEEAVVEETLVNEEVEETDTEETPEENVSEVEQEAVEESESEGETPEEDSTEENETEETEALAEEETPEEEVSEVEKEAVAESEDEEEEPIAVEKEEEPSVEEEEETPIEIKTEEKKESLFEPTFELAFDKKEDVEEVAKESGHQIIFEDFLGSDYKELEFVKAEIEKHNDEPEPVKAEVVEEIEEFKEVQEAPEEVEEPVKREFPNAPQYEGIKITKGITFGLNDKVGFVSQLFGGSNEDFNRVISQLNTFNTFQDAKNFIEDLVKPDYNDWKGKEDFEERFLEVVEQKFK